MEDFLFPKHIAVLDFETTGQDPRKSEVIEGAVALVKIGEDGKVEGVVERYESFNEPGAPIPPFIEQLTGINDAMVKGHKIDWAAFNSLCDKAELLVAHNAKFDRGFLEVHSGAKGKRWACSSSMIEWRSTHRMPCGHLKHLAWEHNHFPVAHRAMSDVDTVVHLLGLPCRGKEGKTYGQEMLETFDHRHFLVSAVNSPFETKDILKDQRFRWNAKKRVWWRLVAEDQLPEVETFLSEQVYAGNPRHTKVEVDPLDPNCIEE
jgi:DNA polymerase-3 subunit epsilon